MSLTRKMHQESTESHAAQQMHNTMGIDPALGQLYDRDLRDELTSKRSDDNDTDVPGDYEATEAEADTTGTAKLDTDREEARRASWGQAPAEVELVTDEDHPNAAYTITHSDEASRRVPDADWNRSTEEGTV